MSVRVLEQVQTFLNSNPIVAGGAGMAVVGGVMMHARKLPLYLWRLFQDQFSMTMTVYSEDAVFGNLSVWLSKHPSMKHTRRLSTAVYSHPREERDEYVLTPGEGLHVLRDGWRFLLVNRSVEKGGPQQNSFYASRQQTLTITSLGRDRSVMEKLLSEAVAIREDHDTIPVYVWHGSGYSLVERRLKRPLDTIYIDAATKADLIDDVKRFLLRRKWYTDRAIPWRRGYCLEGPPGTGKTSLIFAVASEIEKPIYLINPSALDNDLQLQRAINEAGAGVVVIEDIDSVKATADREEKKAIKKAVVANAPGAYGLLEPAPPSEGSKAGVTLSGLLNAVDGIGSRDGRILFISSNHADGLDAALLRPGRIDKRYYLDFAGKTEALAMFERFFPDEPVDEFANDIARDLPISPATLQNRLLGLAEAAA